VTPRLRDKRVHVVDQAKYLETGQIWRDAALRLAAQHPDVHMTRQDASHFFYDFMIDSSRYDVIVSEMGLGHLISSMAAGHTGSLAIHAAAYLGGDVPLFQPSHGSNPEEAGRGVANPLGMIRAVSLMLRLAMGQRAACTELDEAIERVVVTHLTHAGPADDTVSLADAVLAALPSAALHPPAR
jgi:3-isopropylmalate dehydrogenase